MNFKLDENLGSLGRQLLAEAGHDVSTVYEQKLSGISDESLYNVCVQERRVLITLDRDFGHVLRFPPEATAGIVVLQSPGRLTPNSLLTRLREFIAVLETQTIAGQLWIVEPGRVRIHESSASDDAQS